MWKPVRLQGVGAASSVINGNSQPEGKVNDWRRRVVCLFGLALNGAPSTGTSGANPFDPDGNLYLRNWTERTSRRRPTILRSTACLSRQR